MALIGTGVLTTGESSVDLASGTGLTVTVGHADFEVINYTTGAAIEAALTGDAWDDLVDINLGVPFEYSLIGISNTDYAIHLDVADTETNGDYVRIQVEVDGVVIVDFTNTSNNTNKITNEWKPLFTGRGSTVTVTSHKMYANSRFRIRAWKNGTFDETAGHSTLRVCGVSYNKLVL